MTVPRKEISRILHEQETLISSISQVMHRLERRTNFPEPFLRERLAMLKSDWERCRQLNAQLEENYLPEDAHLPYFADKYFSVAEITFEDTVDLILENLPEQKEHFAVNDGAQSLSRLLKPRVTLPDFSGLYTEWLYFREMFKSLVIDDDSLSDIERLQYLITSLYGEAQTRR
ncbi:uncharacterized protein LOC127279570 [Leptopilina boulardi]|uniref:uncharacterized protein LOC127279570 n=1 Tax=Leptopilina boulardi TaxID=63433 RepID=UPI0021F64DB5|nr:uncharacterized protein LOC127279570 [Leptopilina boulardi]